MSSSKILSCNLHGPAASCILIPGILRRQPARLGSMGSTGYSYTSVLCGGQRSAPLQVPRTCGRYKVCLMNVKDFINFSNFFTFFRKTFRSLETLIYTKQGCMCSKQNIVNLVSLRTLHTLRESSAWCGRMDQDRT